MPSHNISIHVWDGSLRGALNVPAVTQQSHQDPDIVPRKKAEVVNGSLALCLRCRVRKMREEWYRGLTNAARCSGNRIA